MVLTNILKNTKPLGKSYSKFIPCKRQNCFYFDVRIRGILYTRYDLTIASSGVVTDLIARHKDIEDMAAKYPNAGDRHNQGSWKLVDKS